LGCSGRQGCALLEVWDQLLQRAETESAAVVIFVVGETVGKRFGSLVDFVLDHFAIGNFCGASSDAPSAPFIGKLPAEKIAGREPVFLCDGQNGLAFFHFE